MPQYNVKKQDANQFLGKKYNLLTILSINHELTSINKRTYFNCLCDCGKETIGSLSVVTKGEKKSCGCNRRAKSKENTNLSFEKLKEKYIGTLLHNCLINNLFRKNNIDGDTMIDATCHCGKNFINYLHRFVNGFTKSCGCLHVLEEYEASINCLMSLYKRRAEKHKREFSLSREYFIKLTSSNCHYCNIEPLQITRQKVNKNYIYNGIDRIDSNKGYIIDNVVPCCRNCNWAKGKSSYENFIKYLNQLVNFRKNL